MDKEFDDFIIQDGGLKFAYDEKLFNDVIFSIPRDLKSILMEYIIDNNFTCKVEETMGQEVYVVKCTHIYFASRGWGL